MWFFFREICCNRNCRTHPIHGYYTTQKYIPCIIIIYVLFGGHRKSTQYVRRNCFSGFFVVPPKKSEIRTLRNLEFSMKMRGSSAAASWVVAHCASTKSPDATAHRCDISSHTYVQRTQLCISSYRMYSVKTPSYSTITSLAFIILT